MMKILCLTAIAVVCLATYSEAGQGIFDDSTIKSTFKTFNKFLSNLLTEVAERAPAHVHRQRYVYCTVAQTVTG